MEQVECRTVGDDIPSTRAFGARTRILVLAVLAIAFVAPCLWAQSTATIQGTVKGPNNAPLQGVQVSVTGGQAPKMALTDEKGFYSIPDLPPGTYKVAALLAPFSPKVVENVVLQGGQKRTVDFSLASLTFSDELSVTVQKRAETLLEIPASVTVLSSDTLEQRQVTDLTDMVSLVPGLSVTTDTPGQTRVTLRGINTGGVSSTVGIYIDDVPFGSSTGLANGAVLAGDFDTFDMAQVEVLRGPQGTLYGASSLGGVLKYVPNRPTTQGLDARFLGRLETVDNGGLGYSLNALVNVPLSDQWAIRASGFYRSDDGFIDSIGNNPVPSLTTPGVNVVDGTMVADNINTIDSYGGRFAALYEPSKKFSLLLTAQTQQLNSGAPGIIDADPITLKPLNELVQSRYFPDTVDTKYEVFSGKIDWDLGAATLVSVTSYGTIEQDIHSDATIAAGLTGGTPLASLVTYLFGDDVTNPLSAVLPQTTGTDKFTQELRLVSPTSETFDWLIGGYYTDESSLISQKILAIEADTGVIAAGVPALAVLSLDSKYKEYALFGNATWHVSSVLDLSFGLRQSWNDQAASQVADGPLAGGHTEFNDLTSSESPFTWSLSPRFELSQTSSIYVRVATGFRPGGPNVLPPDAPEGTPATFGSDTLTSYEAGWKTNSTDGKFSLDLSAFYLDWQDIQLYAIVNGFGVNGNGGTAVSKGSEFTASVIPTGGLTVSLNGAYTDAYLTADTDPVVGGTNGDALPYISDWTFGLSADYEWPVGTNSLADVGGSVSYIGSRPFEFTARTAEGSLQMLDSYVTVDLRAGAYIGRWSFELYGKNLTNEMGVTSVDTGGNLLPNGAYGLALIRPRTVGLSVGVRLWGS